MVSNSSVPSLTNAVDEVKSEPDCSPTLAKALHSVMSSIIDEYPHLGEYWESSGSSNASASRYRLSTLLVFAGGTDHLQGCSSINELFVRCRGQGPPIC